MGPGIVLGVVIGLLIGLVIGLLKGYQIREVEERAINVVHTMDERTERFVINEYDKDKMIICCTEGMKDKKWLSGFRNVIHRK